MGTKRRARARTHGRLVIIGGHEQRDGESIILKAVAEAADGGKLVVCTVASDEPDELWREYQQAFGALGVRRLAHLDVPERASLLDDPALEVLDGAKALFFTGGGQLKITTRFAGTPLCLAVEEFYRRGGTIAGTSAGASVMADTMLVSGNGRESHRIAENLLMAPGLGFIRNVLIDQHFAERGRIGRLLGSVAQNPRLLGLGIDEDTAVVVEQGRSFSVIGSGAVYVADARSVTYTNVAEEAPERTLSIFDVRLHVLSQGDHFDLPTRTPTHRFASTVSVGAAAAAR
jgi:cyanophycinase